MLDSSHGVVFSGYGQYSNSLLHPYDNGFCTECGQYEPAEKNGSVYEISNAGQLFWFAAWSTGIRPMPSSISRILAPKRC